LFLTHCSTTDPTEVFVSDRNVTGLNIPALDTARMRGLGDSASGWQITWNPPLSPDGWQRTYIFFDTLTDDDVTRLRNGGELGQEFSAKFQIVSKEKTSFDIPTTVFKDKDRVACPEGCRGMKAPTTREFWFTAWAQYGDGSIGQPIRYRLFLGDEYPPTLPAIRRHIGSDSAMFAWDSVFDQTSRFVSHQYGQLKSIRWMMWRGLYQRDSARIFLKTDSSKVGDVWSVADVARITDTAQWADSLTDSSKINQPGFRLHLSGLRPFHTYTLLVQYVDRFGKTSTSTSQIFTTRDSLPPVGVTDIQVEPQSPTAANVGFGPACDTFIANTEPLTSKFPNRNIRWITAILNGTRVDSVEIKGDSTVGLGTEWSSGNWSWNKTRWTWTWGSLDPGSTDSIRFEVSDLSGNPQSTPTPTKIFTMPISPAITGLTCPAGYTAVGAGYTKIGTDTARTSVPAYCMETWPRTTAGRFIDTTTWSQAQSTCDSVGGMVCSEAQWQHACEGDGDSTALHYGVTGLPGSDDSIGLLRDRCGLFSGDSSWLTRRDPRCLGPWGVRGLAGPLHELVSGSFGSDSNFTGVHILKGGTWLLPSNLATAKSSAACRYRNYLAWSDSILVKAVKVPRPRTGLSKNIGFRCCLPATGIAGRRTQAP
jgi:hypothetical protein